MVFQFWGLGHPQDDTMPNFFPYSKSSILGLSNEVFFVFKFYVECSENQSIVSPLLCTVPVFFGSSVIEQSSGTLAGRLKIHFGSGEPK